MSWTKDVKLGNFLIYKDSFICIVTKIIKQSDEIFYEGIDSMNRSFYGNKETWKPISENITTLVNFKDVVCDNIASYKKKKQ